MGDVFTRRCNCGRILKQRESCPTCAERRRMEMHARVDKLGTLGQGIDEHEMRPAGIFDKGLLTEVFKQERLAQKADAEWQRELRTVATERQRTCEHVGARQRYQLMWRGEEPWNCGVCGMRDGELRIALESTMQPLWTTAAVYTMPLDGDVQRADGWSVDEFIAPPVAMPACSGYQVSGDGGGGCYDSRELDQDGCAYGHVVAGSSPHCRRCGEQVSRISNPPCMYKFESEEAPARFFASAEESSAAKLRWLEPAGSTWKRITIIERSAVFHDRWILELADHHWAASVHESMLRCHRRDSLADLLDCEALVDADGKVTALRRVK